jgi:hypothetical protein
VTEGEAVASSMRDVGAESAARANRGGGYAARGMGLVGRKAEGAGERASFPFSFILAFVFSFLFIYFLWFKSK